MVNLPFFPDHRLYDFALWANSFELFDDTCQLPVPSEENWQDWARALGQTSWGRNHNLPDPEPFAEWGEWASMVRTILL
jgi:hypothetical protein